MKELKNKAVLGSAGLAILGLLGSPINADVHTKQEMLDDTIMQEIQTFEAKKFLDKYETNIASEVQDEHTNKSNGLKSNLPRVEPAILPNNDTNADGTVKTGNKKKKYLKGLKNKAVLGAAGLAILGVLNSPVEATVHTSCNNAYHQQVQVKSIKQETQLLAAKKFFNKYEAQITSAVQGILTTDEDVTKRLEADFVMRVEQEILLNDERYPAKKYGNKNSATAEFEQAMSGYDIYKDVLIDSTKYLNMFYHFKNNPENSNIPRLDENELDKNLQSSFAKAVVICAFEKHTNDIKLTPNELSR